MNNQYPVRRRVRDGVLAVTVLLFLWFGGRIIYSTVRSHFLPKEMAGRGRIIASVLTGWNLEGAGKYPTVYPTTSEYGGKSSTEYFRYVESLGIFREVPFSSDLLAASGVSSVSNPTNLAELSSNNAWCITLDITCDQSPQIPLVFTRNLAFTGTTLDTFIGLDKDAQPFGDKFGVVVTVGCLPKILTKDSTVKDFNPTGATNRFLWP